MDNTILEVENLHTYFHTDEGTNHAVKGVDFSLSKGETLAIVGESGSGKSVTSLSVLRLINSPGKIEKGKIIYNDIDVLGLSEKEMRGIRGNEISMIFQEPMTSLNPVYTAGQQISESLKYHQGLNKQEAIKKSIEMLDLVGIPNPERSIYRYPHELSGGMRQRVMIAMALACNPKVLIADEPTTALDVTIQAQIIDLLADIRDKIGISIILITHDMGVVAEMAENVMVMYKGQVVEYGDVHSIFHEPLHPYTQGLLKAIPRLDIEQDTLYSIEDSISESGHWSIDSELAFRCKDIMNMCNGKGEELISLPNGRKVRCWKYEGNEINE